MPLMFMATGLSRRDGVYYFRARIPTHLVSAYGREVVMVSLRTRDASEAKRLALLRRVELDQALAALEKAAKPSEDLRGAVLFLEDSQIESLCNRFRATKLAEDELQRIRGFRQSEQELDIDLLEAGLPGMRGAYARGDVTNVIPSLNAFLREQGLAVAKGSPTYARLARSFQQAELEVYEAILKRRSGTAVPIPLSPVSGVSFDEVLGAWKRQKGTNAKTVRSFEQAFELFKKHTLAPAANLVKKADVITFRNHVLDSGEVSQPTLKKHIGFLRAAFQVAVDDAQLEVNPFAGVKVIVAAKASSEKARLPFSLQELQAIFTGPVYQPGYKPRESLGASCYWLPLLGLFTGARLEELAQLERSDIESDPKLGPFICVRRAVDRSKRTKTLNSVRNFPVHPQLIKLGFVDYCNKFSKGRLFPALRADKYGILSTSFSTWFGRYLDELGITDSTRVFHSFRHSFIQRGKEKITVVPAEVREAIVGHLSASQIESVYGTSMYPLEPQLKAMRHIKWPGLDLMHLEVKT